MWCCFTRVPILFFTVCYRFFAISRPRRCCDKKYIKLFKLHFAGWVESVVFALSGVFFLLAQCFSEMKEGWKPNPNCMRKQTLCMKLHSTIPSRDSICNRNCYVNFRFHLWVGAPTLIKLEPCYIHRNEQTAMVKPLYAIVHRAWLRKVLPQQIL